MSLTAQKRPMAHGREVVRDEGNEGAIFIQVGGTSKDEKSQQKRSWKLWEDTASPSGP